MMHGNIKGTTHKRSQFSPFVKRITITVVFIVMVVLIVKFDVYGGDIEDDDGDATALMVVLVKIRWWWWWQGSN